MISMLGNYRYRISAAECAKSLKSYDTLPLYALTIYCDFVIRCTQPVLAFCLLQCTTETSYFVTVHISFSRFYYKLYSFIYTFCLADYLFQVHVHTVHRHIYTYGIECVYIYVCKYVYVQRSMYIPTYCPVYSFDIQDIRETAE